MWEVRFYYLEGRGGGGGGRFSLHAHAPHKISTHLVATRPLSSSARAGRGAAAGRHSVESHSTASATVNDASGTGGRETKAPSANCAHETTRAGPAACRPPAQHPPSTGIIANCIFACAHRTTRGQESAVNVHTSSSHSASAFKSSGSGTIVFGHTPPYPYDDRFNTYHIWL